MVFLTDVSKIPLRRTMTECRAECKVYLFMIIVRTFQFEQSQSVTEPDVKIARRYREED